MGVSFLTELFSLALGKGPYQLSSMAASGALVATKAAGHDIALVRAKDVEPGDIVSFLLTAALYKAKAHGKAHPGPSLALLGGREAGGGGEGAETLSHPL
jgi:hypothetical protein